MHILGVKSNNYQSPYSVFDYILYWWVNVNINAPLSKNTTTEVYLVKQPSSDCLQYNSTLWNVYINQWAKMFMSCYSEQKTSYVIDDFIKLQNI